MKIKNAYILVNFDTQIKQANREIKFLSELKNSIIKNEYWSCDYNLLDAIKRHIFTFFLHKNKDVESFQKYIYQETQIKIIDMIVFDIQKRIDELTKLIIEYGGELD